jgi:hypothetical protein
MLSLFDETSICKDLIPKKKASKFYNLHLNQDPRLNKKEERKEKEMVDMKGKKKDNNHTEEKIKTVLDTYNYENRKLVYKMMSEFIPKENVANWVSTKNNFNDLNALLSHNKQAGQKTLFYSSDGDFFRVFEGVFFGAQVFEAGFPFEIAKKKQAFKFDVPRWALLLASFCKETHSIDETSITDSLKKFIKIKTSLSNAELFAKLNNTDTSQETKSNLLSKRSESDFKENDNNSDKAPSLNDVLLLLNSIKKQIPVSNECNTTHYIINFY